MRAADFVIIWPVNKENYILYARRRPKKINVCEQADFPTLYLVFCICELCHITVKSWPSAKSKVLQEAPAYNTFILLDRTFTAESRENNCPLINRQGLQNFLSVKDDLQSVLRNLRLLCL